MYVFSMCVLVKVVIVVKKQHDQSNYEEEVFILAYTYRQQSITEESQVRKSNRARIWNQGLTQRPWRCAAFLLACQKLLRVTAGNDQCSDVNPPRSDYMMEKNSVQARRAEILSLETVTLLLKQLSVSSIPGLLCVMSCDVYM